MNIARSLKEWRRYRATSGDLSRLSNRELEDIGMNRADIPAIARQASRI